MVGFSHRIQIRHIVVEKKEVAELLKETIDGVKGATAKNKLLMKLAPKYSLCPSKEDGGNLGWLELSCDDPRITGYTPTLKNAELEEFIRKGMRTLAIKKGELCGPVKTGEGYHILLVCNEFGAELADGFTGSAV
ncbi:MAG: peptidylprolyl isomerase [Nitrospinae bacterium]|nr:peptidylprolyl isomerase [Nitrospinota bacterium]